MTEETFSIGLAILGALFIISLFIILPILIIIKG